MEVGSTVPVTFVALALFLAGNYLHMHAKKVEGTEARLLVGVARAFYLAGAIAGLMVLAYVATYVALDAAGGP